MRAWFQGRPLAGDSNQGKAVVVVVTLVFVLLVAVGVATGLWSTTANQEPAPAPSELAGYPLAHSVAGPEAIADIDDLHGTAIDIVDAWIGHYRGGGAVWVAQASDEARARELLDEMVRNIEDGGSPFRGLTRQEFQTLPVYRVRGASQTHYFYQIDAQVVWVATPPGAEEAFLLDALRKVI